MQTKTQHLLLLSLLKNNQKNHQIEYQHLIKKQWLLGCIAKKENTKTESESFANRNFDIASYSIAPKVTYLLSKKTNLEVFCRIQNKKNTIDNQESLQQTEIGSSFSYTNQNKFSISSSFSIYKNVFEGDNLSAVGFQMLEGLQPGNNQTFRFLMQKNLTKYLDLNLSYMARKSENNPIIHIGNVQLKAYF